MAVEDVGAGLNLPDSGYTTSTYSVDNMQVTDTSLLGGVSNISGGSGYMPYAAAISTISNVASGFAETSAFKDKVNAEVNAYVANLKSSTDAAIKNSGNLITSYELQQSQNKQQIENINFVLGDKLSERGLSAMKEAALLRTAAAETGTTGGTTDFATKEAFINENMDKANIVSSARQQVRGILMSMDISELATEHQIDSILLGGTPTYSGVNASTNPLFSGIAGGASALTNTLGMLPKSELSKLFNI